MLRGVKELGEAHLSWQLAAWVLCAQTSELDTSGEDEEEGVGRKEEEEEALITQTSVSEQFNNRPESSCYDRWIFCQHSPVSKTSLH